MAFARGDGRKYGNHVSISFGLGSRAINLLEAAMPACVKLLKLKGASAIFTG